MAQVVLFHHAHGLTDGVRAFADDLRAAGHEVTVPDLYDGQRFNTVEEGVAHADALGFGTVIERGVAAAEDLPADVVYAGFSLGAMPAQWLAQTRAGARGVLLYHSAVPVGEFGDGWPDRLPVQLHIMVDDPFDDLAVMEELASVAGGELYIYDGDAHLFTDRSLAEFDAAATELVLERTLAFLARLD